ncbi:alkyldihydroxyacetonephosphate synthase [Microbacteriaceae bacterium SG_E_30_P1]|uniref:Alkyldihydroxyacetonephosphate synthase n=1 Tax=Antiquaquibacter oligotrophicus TaxID=2880260 RepID=A0ABT6KPV3_9MICO|nr:FAD-binding oxidoreductase [Antiquaquibacter oligotrophicus]MDH6181187.1 alkyldihydroxyacetonephosphate synthase [Antiquaquibacter oligotrophicus]UDF13118.1 FAD-binding oxidoreductase [Antiquaquibacter oligotrophicus]
MTAVKHMKWWGWGRDGVGFHHEDKPGFAPFVLNAVGLDLATATPVEEPAFDELTVPASTIGEALRTSLVSIVGEEYATTDDLVRVIHTYGKSLRDLVRIRANSIERAPDIVVYPADEKEVQAVVDAAVAADAVIIPFGGGSNIAGSLEPRAGESRVVISLDLGRLDRLIEIDADSGLARIQAGAQGPDLEEQLNARGWTIGHFPDSFTHSTLGGWVATRSSGMQSDKYGDIADITRGLRVVRPGGVLVLRPLPSTSSGPSIREMILGSEGRLGVITEVTVQVHRKPAKRDVYAYFFPTFEAGIRAMQDISESDAAPSITRISDAPETGFSLATSKDRKGFDKFLAGTVLPGLMRSKGWDLEKICLSFIGYEGSVPHAKRQKKLVDSIVKKHGGMGVGTGPGILYDQKKFDTPYLRDFLLDRGAAGDVSETAAPWSKLIQVHDNTIAAAQAAYNQLGIKGWIMSHMSHSYHSGACLYFTFAFVFGDDPLGEYDVVKKAIQQAFVDNGGTISHHHGVGREHSPWLEEDISPEGVAVMGALFGGADPGSNLNPGKIIGAGY